MPSSPEPFKLYSLGKNVTCKVNMGSFFPIVNERFLSSKNQKDISTVMILLCFFIVSLAFMKLKEAVKWKPVTNRAC